MNDIALPAAPKARPRALRTRARLLVGPSLAAAASAALTLLAPAAASASDPAAALGALGAAVVEALSEMTFYSQGQIGAAAAVSDWGQPGGVSLRASMSLFGIGVAGAIRYERVGGRDGGGLALGGQLRPLGLLEMKIYRRIDPFLSLGAEVGGERDLFRASGYVGAGLDVALFPDEDPHPAFVLEYQLRPLRTPSDTPLQILHLGAAMRGVF
jgi:hypothetical protein